MLSPAKLQQVGAGVIPADLAQSVHDDIVGTTLALQRSKLQEANAQLADENAVLAAEEQKLARYLQDERAEQHKIRAQSAEMRAELMLQRRGAAQERRSASMQLDLALGSLQREKEVSSSLERARDEQTNLSRLAAGKAHVLTEENQR